MSIMQSTAPPAAAVTEGGASRLSDVGRFRVPGPLPCDIDIALPADYRARRRARYPLLFVLDTGYLFGSVAEIARLMHSTDEVRPCIVAALRMPEAAKDVAALMRMLTTQLLPACTRRYRVEPGAVVVCDLDSRGRLTSELLRTDTSGIDHLLAADPRQLEFARHPGPASRSLLLVGTDSEHFVQCHEQARARLPQTVVRDFSFTALHGTALATPAVAFTLRTLFATGRAYGHQVVPLRRRPIVRLLETLRPIFARLQPRPATEPAGNPYRMSAPELDRDFEVFISLPAAARAGHACPLLIVLDANIEYSMVTETARRLARDGRIEELIVVGIGTPRIEGHAAFGFRRFEELFPPQGEDRFDDDLGRIMRSLYAMRGQRARERLGQGAAFYRFITRQLLPQLQRDLPVDSDALGIVGHSAAGTFVGYALCQPDNPFKRLLSISPGVGISDSWLMRCPLPAGGGDAALFVAIGDEERSNAFNIIAGIPDSEAFAARMQGVAGLRVQTCALPHQTHSSVFPAALPAGLDWLYPVTDRSAVVTT
ncbi:alpha/beta hydrolase [Solimonas marina]|uniref:Alpha/beta hydrolase n=1 Tax=Solimonas marina TaxID=2714601 RepID=A0A969WAL8_9GAMM|nr:alpha/beta hydrolase-fold protein [Solimonas marina]NKF22994.1 alpha/beta hydrolase [Solimonas marina]